MHATTRSTDLPNRRGLTEVLAAGPGPIGVLYVDLDRFKPVNDRHGHATGDHVLQAAARRMERAVRPSDAVARIGGDEFVVVLADEPGSGGDHRAVAEQVADRVLRELCRPVRVNEVDIDLAASIGIAVAAEHGDGRTDVDGLLAAADAAMYVAKRAGGRQARLASEPVT